jgi:hypothetical protein
MQTLGLSDSTPRTEGRLKSLFWPAVQTADDVDYLGTQGFWVCTLVAVLSLVFSLLTGHPVIGVVVALFFYLGGVGVREHSVYAAVVVLMMYLGDAIVAGPSIVRIGIAAVLFSNLRATWIAYLWNTQALEAASPPRLAATWSDKFADRVPMWLWPRVRYPYYVLSVLLLLLQILGLAMMVRNRTR